ncbi:hypothetical protein GPECTOR_8g354 [Gonium pectorale]|uniref:RING-type domain-containing protein n=1 Tax=Gonium pectorale TaxID=33097 RepID=A0A150GT47_GONPE|nr:hypothetical protein GPECTOR_8g354 [Gonium pectorale]|eukprot:KXZ52983.1 hypothetical protein GPECTOR_8g354 [Gonium pectorale]
MGCTTSCIAPSVAELNKSLRAGDERALLLQLQNCPKLLSSTTSVLSSNAITPLHVACENKQIKVVQHVISFLSCSTLDVVAEALLPFCRRAGLPLPTSVAEGVRLACGMTNGKGQTPLMYACYSDCPELVKLLLEQGADPWVGDRCGRRTALHYAAMGGSVSSIAALMAHVPARQMTRAGVRYIDARSLCGLTPLHYCAYHGRTAALRELLRHAPQLAPATSSESYDVSLTAEVGSTPLHFAAMRGHGAAAREILLAHVNALASSHTAPSDLRARHDAAGQMPWRVAVVYHPADEALAAMLHPGLPLERALHLGAWAADAAAVELVGPHRLAVLAAAALREKLLSDVQCAQEQQEGETAAATTAAATTAAGEAEAEDAETEEAPQAATHSSHPGPASCTGPSGPEAAAAAVANGSRAANIVGTDVDEDEGMCGVCFAAPEQVAPVGCRHGLCAGCAGELCRALGGVGGGCLAAATRPLRCPFCRGPVAAFVAHAAAGQQSRRTQLQGHAGVAAAAAAAAGVVAEMVEEEVAGAR